MKLSALVHSMEEGKVVQTVPQQRNNSIGYF